MRTGNELDIMVSLRSGADTYWAACRGGGILGRLPAWICFTGGPRQAGRRQVLAATSPGLALRLVVMTLIACSGTGIAGIGQLADVPGRQSRDGGRVEIRIVLDRAEPPAGRLRVVRDPGQAHHPGSEQEVSFTGWLGLLRALYGVTAEPGAGSRPGV
jgi:hypothetical protein